MTWASGRFEVTLTPQGENNESEGSELSRFLIDKTFHGDLEATSRGQMLAANTGVKGSAGYVAIERVAGMLAGRSGSFMLQHNGIMARGAQQLNITVVPDSATGQLTGLTGTMTITIVDREHLYDFEYTFADNS